MTNICGFKYWMFDVLCWIYICCYSCLMFLVLVWYFWVLHVFVKVLFIILIILTYNIEYLIVKPTYIDWKGITISSNVLIRALYCNYIALPIPLWWPWFTHSHLVTHSFTSSLTHCSATEPLHAPLTQRLSEGCQKSPEDIYTYKCAEN